MTDRELMQQALGYMESVGQMDMYPEEWAIAVALRERLAQPQRTHWEGCDEVHPECKKPRREWVGLTDDQVSAIADQHPVEGFDPSIMAFARAIEAKLREKNHV